MRICHWYEDETGARIMIPGCLSRALDPDAEACTCPTLDQQLAAARRSIERLQRAVRGGQEWRDCVTRAVYDHPDGIAIMKAAADAASARTPAGPGRRG